MTVGRLDRTGVRALPPDSDSETDARIGRQAAGSDEGNPWIRVPKPCRASGSGW
jgi:hypothetical protein